MHFMHLRTHQLLYGMAALIIWYLLDSRS